MTSTESSASTSTPNAASFEPHLLITQLLEIPLHIPNTFIKVKYRYRNRVYRYKSGLMNVYGGMVDQQKRVHSTGSADSQHRHSSGATSSAHRFIYQIPLPQNIQLAIHQKTRILEPLFIHCKIRSKNKKKALKKIGEVCINLAEYANDKDFVSRRYLLHKCKMNALLCVSVAMRQVSGDKLFRCPHEDSFYTKDRPLDSTDSLDGGASVKRERRNSPNGTSSSVPISDVASLNQSFDFEQFSSVDVRTSGSSGAASHYRNSSALLVESLISETLGCTPDKSHNGGGVLHNASLNISSLSFEMDTKGHHGEEDASGMHGEEDTFSDYTPATTMSPPLYDSIIGTISGADED